MYEIISDLGKYLVNRYALCLKGSNMPRPPLLFDSSLNFRKHISQTCRACFYNIRDLRRIQKSLSLDLAKQIAMALVSSKLDYCNSLFHNMPEKDIAILQRVQNCLTRVVTKAPRFSRSVNSTTFTLASCQVSHSF